jgi:hypothetical protein
MIPQSRIVKVLNDEMAARILQYQFLLTRQNNNHKVPAAKAARTPDGESSTMMQCSAWTPNHLQAVK